MNEKMCQNITIKTPQSFTGKTCSPLLHYHCVNHANSCGNAIANSPGLLHAETGFSYFGARYYDSDILTGWLSVDPLADKYPSLSPYAYCAWNPVKLVDPDGRIVRISDNYVNGIENIAKIAATSLGATVISHLMARGDVYTLNSTFFTSNSSYNPKNRDVNYVKNPWYNEIPYDGGILNSMIAMGHELFHAFDHSKNIFNSANAKLRKNIAEPRAVSFANYLREAILYLH